MRRRLLVALLAVLLLVTGCATVPTKGTVRSGSRQGLAPDLGGVGVEAKPPRDTFNDMDIVNGFLEAMSDSQGALDIARRVHDPGGRGGVEAGVGDRGVRPAPGRAGATGRRYSAHRPQDRDDQPARRVDPRAGERAGRLLLQADQGERAVPGRLGAARGVPGQQPGGSEARPARSVLLHAGPGDAGPRPGLSAGEPVLRAGGDPAGPGAPEGPDRPARQRRDHAGATGHRGPGVGPGRVRAWRQSRSTTRPRRCGTRTAGCSRPRSSGRSTRSASGSRSPWAAHRCCRTTRTSCRSRTSASTTRRCPAAP